MRSLSLAVLLVGVLTSNGFASTRVTGKVTKVSDGDTIQVQILGGSKIKVRLESIDTPETTLAGPGGTYSQGYWGDQASALLKAELPIRTTVDVEIYGKDGYGRSLGRILKNGVDLNLELIESGWAVLYEICDTSDCKIGNLESRQVEEYRAACNRAVKTGAGNFDPARPLPELPFLFRSRIQKRPLSKFVGNVKTGEYVEPSRFDEIPICDRVFFMEERFARENGFSPSTR